LLVGVRNKNLPNIRSSYCEDAVKAGFLPGKCLAPPNLEDLLGDLIDENYEIELITRKYPHAATHLIQQDMRKSSKMRKKGANLNEQEYSRHKLLIKEKFQYMIDHGIRSMKNMPIEFRTNKFSQRVLPLRWDEVGGSPNITATSLPDDYVHFSQPRSLTVREWARLQGFPDDYKFCGKRTTGGVRRAGDPSKNNWDREVPKYTQIGNAVPVRLAHAVGYHLLDKFIK
jgi:DNA (cytosine-5)-methyltransferase 1